jgi:hypothetical protein
MQIAPANPVTDCELRPAIATLGSDNVRISALSVADSYPSEVDFRCQIRSRIRNLPLKK